MSITERAVSEMALAGFSGEDQETMAMILGIFFDAWDSGGAVSVMVPVLTRCLAGKCLTPLTGDESEWVDVGDGIFQNNRVGSVFKDPRFHDGLKAYDLDNPAGPREAIEFPYWPERAEVPSPVVIF